MLLGRYNALEFDGRTARRYPVRACVIRGGTIESAEVGEAPVEEVQLPMKRGDAMIWAVRHFEDFDPERLRALVDRLTRPTAELVGRRTDPLA